MATHSMKRENGGEKMVQNGSAWPSTVSVSGGGVKSPPPLTGEEVDEVDEVHEVATAGGGATSPSHPGGQSESSSSSIGALNCAFLGAPSGHHGPYTFFRAVRVEPVGGGGAGGGPSRVLALGDFFLVKLWSHQEIISIGELQLLWEDKFNGQPLASIKLYFLPENTPDGRHEEHGQDEVVSISEKVILKVVDLMSWIVEDVKWEKGAGCIWEKECRQPPPGDTSLDATNAAADAADAADYHGPLDMRDVIKEKQAIGEGVGSNSKVIVLSYPAYCRYRSALKRLETCEAEQMRQAVVTAIGGRTAPGPNTRVVFCKDTFDYPELEDHQLLCNHLAPKWKGRPRKVRKKRSNSPGSESNESESSVSTVTSSTRSKDSPMKNGIRNVPAPYRAGERPKGEQMFLQKLHKFMALRGTPIGRLPSLGFKQLDLFMFFAKVQRAGGYEAAVSNKLWKAIYIELGGHPSNTSAATCTRRHYEKLLLPYERHNMEETTSCVTPPKKRKLSDPDLNEMAESGLLKERMSRNAESNSNLTLQELMTVGDPNLLATDAQHSALSDLARIANQLDGSGSSSAGSSGRKCGSSSDSVQISVVSSRLKSLDAQRPSVIQKKANSRLDDRDKGVAYSSKSASASTCVGEPLPAHSQKAELPTPELCQFYAQMLSDKSAHPEMSLRLPTPAAATPSIFVPSHRIYGDPALDFVRKHSNRNPSASGTSGSANSGSSSAVIPAAHSTKSQATTAIVSSASASVSKVLGNHLLPVAAPVLPPPPPPPTLVHSLVQSPVTSRSSTHPSAPHPRTNSRGNSWIPLVDLTCRPLKGGVESELRQRMTPTLPASGATEALNGKCLLDLSVPVIKSSSSSSTNPSKWPIHPPGMLPVKSSAASGASGGMLTLAGDVSISLNVKIEGGSGSGSQNHTSGRHSVSVVPVVKDELNRMHPHRMGHGSGKESKELIHQRLLDRVSVTPATPTSSSSSSSTSTSSSLNPVLASTLPASSGHPYPRMVDSLVSHSGSGSSSNARAHHLSATSKVSGAPTSLSTTSSSSSCASSTTSNNNPPPPSSMYAGLLDPTLASYYTSLYPPHMFGLASAHHAHAHPFMNPGVFAGHQHHLAAAASTNSSNSSATTADVTAQVYKDLVQRHGYPPALAPALPPHLSGALANLPGLNSLGAFASMYSSLGGAKEGPSAGERSGLPKS